MNEQQYQAVIDTHPDMEGPLLPLLHRFQHEFGHIPPDAVPIIARALNLSRAEVHGVISFYRDFTDTPADKPIVKLCQAEACQATGARLLKEHASQQDEVAIESVYCLGLCACGPAMAFDGELYARVTPALFDELTRK